MSPVGTFYECDACGKIVVIDHNSEAIGAVVIRDMTIVIQDTTDPLAEYEVNAEMMGGIVACSLEHLEEAVRQAVRKAGNYLSLE